MKKNLLSNIALISAISVTSLFSMTEKELNSYKTIDGLNQPSVKLLAGKKIKNNLALIKGYIEYPGKQYSPINIITDKKILIPYGDVRDLVKRKKITLDIDYSKFEKNAAYKFGKGKKKIMLFTEAECPACKQSDPYIQKLADNYTVYVYMYPLDGMHLVAKDMALATLSQPEDKREKFYKRYLSNKNVVTLLPELEKHSVELYKQLLKGLDSLDQRRGLITQRYINYIESAYNKKFSTKTEIINFCKEKIEKFEKTIGKSKTYIEANKKLEEGKFLANAYLGVNGTPSLFKYDGDKTDLNLLLNVR